MRRNLADLRRAVRASKNTEQVTDRVFPPRSEQREERRRRILEYPEEERRSDATEIGGKTTGVTCSVF
jgi:hypothetical protein